MKRALFLLSAVLVGCTPIPPGQDEAVKVKGDTPDSVVCIVIEPTGREDIDARTVAMVDKILKQYRTQEAASNRIILARVGDPPLIESMTGTDFKARYPDGIKTLMVKQNGSPIYHTIVETVTEAKPFLGKGRCGLFVFSPIKDTREKGDNPGGGMLRAAVEFGMQGGSLGFYGVDRQSAPQLRRSLEGLVKHYVITTDSDINWPLPEFK